MHEIKCPKCGATFKVDESSYADIVKQVHNKAFNEQLHKRLKAAEQDKQKVAASKDSEIQELRHSLDEAKLKTDLEAKSLKERYETQIQDRDDQIERLRDLKSKLSTKMIGESLEQHCMNEFNKIRATAFPTAYFEKDSDLYNAGIVDVSYRFEKMYAIRPQFFIPMITVLRNAALNSMQYKKQLADERAQNIDITNFEDELSEFKDAFGKNVDLAARKFNTTIEEIDKSITHLNKIRENLVGSQRNLELASKKADNVTIRKLTRGNETMKRKFENAEKW